MPYQKQETQHNILQNPVNQTNAMTINHHHTRSVHPKQTKPINHPKSHLKQISRSIIPACRVPTHLVFPHIKRVSSSQDLNKTEPRGPVTLALASIDLFSGISGRNNK